MKQPPHDLITMIHRFITCITILKIISITRLNISQACENSGITLLQAEGLLRFLSNTYPLIAQLAERETVD